VTERKLGLALTLAIVLESIEILRRTPRWLLVPSPCSQCTTTFSPTPAAY
jgi:hypothetical protein